MPSLVTRIAISEFLKMVLSILAFLAISRRLNAQELEAAYDQREELSLEQIPELITQLEAQMKEAAKNLEFEAAANYRDRIKQLREKLLGRPQG